MLPRIHLGSLLTATQSELSKQSREQKQNVLERRADRNLEGFYVYQTYLRRLRRMHKAYVARYKRSHPGTKKVPPPPRTSEFYSSQYYDEGGFIPMRHRLALSEHACKSRRVVFDDDEEEQRTVPTPPSTPLSCRSPVLSDPNAIHIPCGRENSSHSLFSQRSSNPTGYSKKTTNDIQRLKNSTSTRSCGQVGALPFRLWRQKEGKSGAASIYSYETIKEEDTPILPSLKSKPGQKTGQHSYVSIKNI